MSESEKLSYWWQDFFDDTEFEEFPTLEALVAAVARRGRGPYDGDLFYGRLLDASEYETALTEIRNRLQAEQTAADRARQEEDERRLYARLKEKYG